MICQFKKFFFACIKITTFALFTEEAWKNDDVEVIEYGGNNQTHLERNIDISNIAGKTQYYSSEFKKLRCEIQECGNYQPCRIFIENTLAVEIIMSSVKTQAVFLGINSELISMIKNYTKNNHWV